MIVSSEQRSRGGDGGNQEGAGGVRSQGDVRVAPHGGLAGGRSYGGGKADDTRGRPTETTPMEEDPQEETE